MDIHNTNIYFLSQIITPRVREKEKTIVVFYHYFEIFDTLVTTTQCQFVVGSALRS